MGGIQTLSRFLVRALRECFPEAAISVFVKNDHSLFQDDSRTRDYASGFALGRVVPCTIYLFLKPPLCELDRFKRSSSILPRNFCVGVGLEFILELPWIQTLV